MNGVLLETTALTRSFGGLTAVDHLDFQVRTGELLSIIGPNGSGKTTAFNLISGFIRPTSGKVTLGGAEITGLKPHMVSRKGVARTFQKTSIFGRATVIDNVIVGQRQHTTTGVMAAVLGTGTSKREERETRERAREILDFVGLLDKESKTAGNLTQEAQKRLSIAMALATRPRLLLLDEPTGGVNVHEIDNLTDLVKRVRESGVTVCIIEHKMRVVMSISDRVVALNYGRKIAEGTPKEIAANEEVIKAYLGARHAA